MILLISMMCVLVYVSEVKLVYFLVFEWKCLCFNSCVHCNCEDKDMQKPRKRRGKVVKKDKKIINKYPNPFYT